MAPPMGTYLCPTLTHGHNRSMNRLLEQELLIDAKYCRFEGMMALVVKDEKELNVKVRAIGEHENKVHNYQWPADDVFAHLETQFKFTQAKEQIRNAIPIFASLQSLQSGNLQTSMAMQSQMRTETIVDTFVPHHSIKPEPSCSLPNSQQNSAGANNLVVIVQAPPLVDFCTLFCSNEANQASMSISTISVILMILKLRYQCGYVFCCDVVVTGLSKDSLPYLVSNGVCQFNTYEFQINKDDLPPTTRDDLKRTQDYDIETSDGAEEEGTADLDLLPHL
ncbi:hypothetical protein V6N12_011765 [Hibiscus sabdariffa]|uniref:Uncharacterized protein n=1 Tax=Hibiscus sabdariffa TaxID=183260 RepID=A0ABR2BTD5_9ROSI